MYQSTGKECTQAHPPQNTLPPPHKAKKTTEYEIRDVNGRKVLIIVDTISGVKQSGGVRNDLAPLHSSLAIRAIKSNEMSEVKNEVLILPFHCYSC